jgi:hypothetical protein
MVIRLLFWVCITLVLSTVEQIQIRMEPFLHESLAAPLYETALSENTNPRLIRRLAMANPRLKFKPG